jgi:septum formation protein
MPLLDSRFFDCGSAALCLLSDVAALGSGYPSAESLMDSVARPLILASASPRRKELLTQLGFPFSVVVAKVVEHEDPETDPKVMVSHNAALKAEWVSSRYPEALVLGADTTVFIDHHALNKPRDLAEARVMLRRLSDRTHQVFTGLSLRCKSTGYKSDSGDITRVTFRKLDEKTIDDYLRLVSVLDKAGAYAVQEHGELIIERYEGSYTNIVGLPLELTKQLLGLAGLHSANDGH